MREDASISFGLQLTQFKNLLEKLEVDESNILSDEDKDALFDEINRFKQQ